VSPARNQNSLTHRHELGLEERVVDVIGRQEDNHECHDHVLVALVQSVGWSMTNDKFEIVRNILEEVFWQHSESQRCFIR
jgi:hypothetical protein